MFVFAAGKASLLVSGVTPPPRVMPMISFNIMLCVIVKLKIEQATGLSTVSLHLNQDGWNGEHVHYTLWTWEGADGS